MFSEPRPGAGVFVWSRAVWDFIIEAVVTREGG
jgi:hypothetical protein